MTADANAKTVKDDSVDQKTSDDVALPTFVQKLLGTIATREGFADGYKILSRSGSKVGDGFMGVLLSIVIAGNRNGNEGEELVLVCKIPPASEIRLKFTIVPFLKEIAAYETILPALVEFQREKGISESDGFFAFPKCYGTHADEEKSEFAIVLEDLRPKGYRMWNKYASIDYQHVKLAFTQLGKFHALSFALRQQRPELFEQFKSIDSHMLKTLDEFPVTRGFYEKNYERVIEALNADDKEEIRRMTHLRQNFKANFRSAVSGAEAEPFAVLCHGDFWNNNMMFQYSRSDSTEPQRAILIDWQLTQYCSPATDLTYNIYSSTEQPLRSAHFNDILHDYHDSLAELLQRLGGNAEKQFSFDDLQRQLNDFGIFGLIMAPVLIPAITVQADNLPDMDSFTKDNMEEFDLMAEGCPDGFTKRVSDMARDFVGRGFFGEKHFAKKDSK